MRRNFAADGDLVKVDHQWYNFTHKEGRMPLGLAYSYIQRVYGSILFNQVATGVI